MKLNGLRKLVFLTLAVAVATTIGCAETPKRVESGVRTQTETPIFLKPGGRYFCLSYSDTTGHNFDLRNAVAQRLIARGYQQVHRPEQADYDIRLVTNYLGYLKDHPNAPVIGRSLGLLAGVGTGAGLAASGALDPFSSAMVGLGAGTAGYLIGSAVDKHNTPDLYLADVHLQVRERINFLGDQSSRRPIEGYRKKSVTTTAGGKTSHTQQVERTEALDSPTEEVVSTARSGAGYSKTTVRRDVADFETQQTSFKAVAKVVPAQGVTEDMALGQLADMLSNAVAGVFPSY